MGTNDRDPTALRIRLAMNMKARRTELAMSQETLAHLSGLNRTFIPRVEKARTNISIDNIQKIAFGLGIDAGDLFALRADDDL